jgi:hypothetical protein
VAGTEKPAFRLALFGVMLALDAPGWLTTEDAD